MVEKNSKETQSNGPTVLIADDEEAVRQVVVTFLDRLGYRTVAAKDGLEALHEIESGDVDLIISDYSMPNLNGLEFFDRLSERSPDLTGRFILITGTMFTEEVSQFVRTHDAPFLEKPFRLGDLMSVVERTLGEAKKQPAAVS